MRILFKRTCTDTQCQWTRVMGFSLEYPEKHHYQNWKKKCLIFLCHHKLLVISKLNTLSSSVYLFIFCRFVNRVCKVHWWGLSTSNFEVLPMLLLSKVFSVLGRTISHRSRVLFPFESISRLTAIHYGIPNLTARSCAAQCQNNVCKCLPTKLTWVIFRKLIVYSSFRDILQNTLPFNLCRLFIF